MEAYPQAQMMLPPGEEMPVQLIHTAAAVLEHSDISGDLKALALDLRRTGFPSEEYPNAVQLLIDAIRSTAPDTTDDDVSALVAAGEVMREAASEADHAGAPAATAAQVTSVEPHGEVRVVRLEAGTAVAYSPGQVIPVMSPQQPGVWTGLVPALPFNQFGQLEFHLPSDAPIGAEIAPGDWLTLGSPRGGVRDSDAERLLIVAAESGFAAAKALVFALLERPQPPEVHLVAGALEPDGLYDTAALDALASTQDWLDVTWVVESRIGTTLEQVVSGVGTWWGRDVIVCAAEERADRIAHTLQAAGAGEVQTVAHDATPEWF